jgi:hypothetical protein
MNSGPRPIGVTIIGILYLVAGVLMLIGGIASFGIIGAIGLPGIGAFTGVLLVVVALVDIGIGIGCFKGWGWVWTLALIWAIFNILVAFYNWWMAGHALGGLWSTFLGILIPLIIIWYLYRENVVRYFGK